MNWKNQTINHTLLAIIIVGAFLVSCSKQSEPELEKIVLPVGYIPNVQFAPFYVAIENGYYRDEGFDVTLQYGYEIDGVSLVGMGEYDFTVASGEQVLLARDKGLPVVYVMNWYQDFPVGISALESSGIEQLEDLKGKTIGIPALQGASYIAYEGLMKVAGLSNEDVILEVIGFTQAELLMNGKVDAVVVYVANTPVQLAAQGIDTVTFPVADYISLVGNGIVVNETLKLNEPEKIAAFVRATLKGVEFAVSSPDESYEICLKYVENLDTNKEGVQYSVLSASIPFWNTLNNGYSSEASWAIMEDLLVDMQLISGQAPLDESFTNEFLP